MGFRDFVTEVSMSKDYSRMKKKIGDAKKGDTAELEKLDKECETLFQARKISGSDFDELTAAIGRKY